MLWHPILSLTSHFPAARRAEEPSRAQTMSDVHDNPDHHLFRAAALRALVASGVVFEMLSPDQAARIAPDPRGNPAAFRAISIEFTPASA